MVTLKSSIYTSQSIYRAIRNNISLYHFTFLLFHSSISPRSNLLTRKHCFIPSTAKARRIKNTVISGTRGNEQRCNNFVAKMLRARCVLTLLPIIKTLPQQVCPGPVPGSAETPGHSPQRQDPRVPPAFPPKFRLFPERNDAETLLRG